MKTLILKILLFFIINMFVSKTAFAQFIVPLKPHQSFNYVFDDQIGIRYKYTVLDSTTQIEGNIYTCIFGNSTNSNGPGGVSYERLREDNYYVSSFKDVTDCDTCTIKKERIFYKKNAQKGDKWAQWYVGIPHYFEVKDTGLYYICGEYRPIKRLEITDSVIYNCLQYWSDDFGLVYEYGEFYKLYLIGGIYNGVVFGDTTLYLTDVKSVKSDDAKKYDLSQNYPNPFNPSTEISFSIPEKSAVLIVIYNSIGKTIATVADEIFEPGNHIISWDAGNLPAGMYVCDMKAGKFHSATKMLLVK